MPLPGTNFTITMKKTHLNWGNFRHTSSRRIIYNEVYIPIPKYIAQTFGIYNSNHSGDILGINIFNCSSADGSFTCKVKTCGCSTAGDIYAKNLQGNGSLKILAPWANALQIKIGDRVNVKWITPTDIVLTHFPQ